MILSALQDYTDSLSYSLKKEQGHYDELDREGMQIDIDLADEVAKRIHHHQARFKVQRRDHGRWAIVESFGDIMEAHTFFKAEQSRTPGDFLRLADTGGELAIYTPNNAKG